MDGILSALIRTQAKVLGFLKFRVFDTSRQLSSSGYGHLSSGFRRCPVSRIGRGFSSRRLSAGAWQRLTGFGLRKSCFRRLPRSRRLCRRRSRRWLTGDGRLAVCRWRRSGLRLTGRGSVWRSRILNRNRFWSDRRRKRRCEQSGGASACNAGTYNSGAGRRRFRCRGRLRLRCRGLNWRGESLGLPTWIGNYNGIGGVIDDDSIVDVVVDDIVWRWRNVFWRVDPDRYRNIHRNRKNIRIHRRRWRSQIDEVNRPRRQEKHRRRRRTEGEADRDSPRESRAEGKVA